MLHGVCDVTGLAFLTERLALLDFAVRAGAARDRGEIELAGWWTDCATWARNAFARCLELEAT